MTDQYDWRYRPEYTGDDSLGDVGSGRGFGADLYELYRVGRIDLPRVADEYADLTTQVHRLAPLARVLFEVEGYVEPGHHRLMGMRIAL